MRKNNFFKLSFLLIFFTSFAFAKDAPEPTSEEEKLVVEKIDQSHFYSTATVQILNKTTAKTSILDLRINQKTQLGNLSITLKKCWQASLDQKPESKMLLEIFEEKNVTEKKEERIFYGWIFASSPSISGLEHPIYDVVALSCKNK